MHWTGLFPLENADKSEDGSITEITPVLFILISSGNFQQKAASLPPLTIIPTAKVLTAVLIWQAIPGIGLLPKLSPLMVLNAEKQFMPSVAAHGMPIKTPAGQIIAVRAAVRKEDTIRSASG